MTLEQKPILHGRDHSPGGNDPIPGLGSGGGIDFDTYPQAGQWLYVETDGPDTSPSGLGMEFYDQGENGIDMASAGCHLQLNDYGSNDAALTAGGDLGLGGDGVTMSATSGITIISHATLDIHATSVFMVDPHLLLRSDKDVVIDSAGSVTMTLDTTGSIADWLVQAQIPTIRLANITSAEFFRIMDGADQPLLEVRGDGTLHILTGATWVADL